MGISTYRRIRAPGSRARLATRGCVVEPGMALQRYRGWNGALTAICR
jgi:hypothetical protein